MSSPNGRRYGVIDEFMLDDADYVIVMTNSFASMGKAEIKRLRQKGKKIGLVRLRMIRPFPMKSCSAYFAAQGVAVVDQNISVGKGGILFSEIASALPLAAPIGAAFLHRRSGRTALPPRRVRRHAGENGKPNGERR
jgi:pyruvate ferredoxin oxidoreductase alpha subunit